MRQTESQPSSEPKPEPIIERAKSPLPLRKIAKYGAIGLLGVLGFSGREAVRDAVHEVIHHPSEIVPGVPGQVEGRRFKPGGYDVVLKKYDRDEYLLLIEQHPDAIADVAEDGVLDGGDRIHPDIGAVYDGAHYDYVRVSGDTYRSFPDGSIITFDGDPVENHLDK